MMSGFSLYIKTQEYSPKHKQTMHMSNIFICEWPDIIITTFVTSGELRCLRCAIYRSHEMLHSPLRNKVKGLVMPLCPFPNGHYRGVSFTFLPGHVVPTPAAAHSLATNMAHVKSPVQSMVQFMTYV